MIPNLRRNRASKHASEFAGQAAKSVANQVAKQTGAVTTAAKKMTDMAAGVAQKASGAAHQQGQHAAGVAAKVGNAAANAGTAAANVAAKAGQGAFDAAQNWADGAGNAAGNVMNMAGTGASAAQAQAWMMVEQMSTLASGSSGGTGAPTASFTPADQAAVIAAIKPAVKHAVDMWKISAKFSDLKVMAMSAIGTPGCLDGPELESQIRSHSKVQSLSGLARDMANGIAEAFSDSFFLWQNAVTVPGLPWYPAFVAYPAAIAPPTPNVPMPLISCVSSKIAKVTVSSELADTIKQALPQPLSSETAFINRVAAGLALGASTWIASSQVMNVLGYGPVPSFAPPYVPAGPVVGGTNIAAPGHLAAAPSMNPIII